MKDLDQAILGFFGRTRTRNMSTRAAAEYLYEHGSRLLVLAGLSGAATKWTTKRRLWLKAHLVDLTAVGPATIVLSRPTSTNCSAVTTTRTPGSWPAERNSSAASTMPPACPGSDPTAR
ncbi:hypothetical protein ACIBG0_22720 [Nocardia sp. NPDC050630]|uniref:hypothetical protein n=1 Tax=Nocardia sp. NPDC050630 TaxID=3364321 RepID=UPI0037BBC76E